MAVCGESHREAVAGGGGGGATQPEGRNGEETGDTEGRGLKEHTEAGRVLGFRLCALALVVAGNRFCSEDYFQLEWVS